MAEKKSETTPAGKPKGMSNEEWEKIHGVPVRSDDHVQTTRTPEDRKKK